MLRVAMGREKKKKEIKLKSSAHSISSYSLSRGETFRRVLRCVAYIIKSTFIKIREDRRVVGFF